MGRTAAWDIWRRKSIHCRRQKLCCQAIRVSYESGAEPGGSAYLPGMPARRKRSSCRGFATGIPAACLRASSALKYWTIGQAINCPKSGLWEVLLRPRMAVSVRVTADAAEVRNWYDELILLLL